MLKFLIISDTHGSVKSWEVIERLSGSVNKYYHLGDVLYHGPRNPIPEGYSPSKLAQILKDKNIIYVRGNCDADVDLSVLHNEDMPKFMILTFGHYKAVLLHGENFHSDEDMIELLNAHNADILFYGHTHIPRLEKIQSKILFNPGSPSLPKSNCPPTYGVVEFSNKLYLGIYTLSGDLYMEMSL